MPFVLAYDYDLTYDANGNLVIGDSYYREYNELNQLVKIRSGNLSSGQLLEEYFWHPTEEKILIKDVYINGLKNQTIYYVSQDYVVVENRTGNYTEKYIYQDGMLVAQVRNTTKEFVHSDHEGSITLITNASESVIENTFHSPFQ